MTNSAAESPEAEAACAPNVATAPLAVVAAHGDLAAGLVSAVAQITGQGGLLVPLTNRGRGAAELEAELRALVDAGSVCAVFTDLPGGSCTMAARRVQRARPGLALATGVNLAALLEFVCASGACAADPSGAPPDAAELVARALDRGRASLVVLGASAAPAACPSGPAGTGPR